MNAGQKVASGIIKPRPLRWHDRPVAALIYTFIQGLSATITFQGEQFRTLMQGGLAEPAIFCVWHNRLALSIPVYNRFVRQPNPSRRMAAMVSASRDGGLLACVLAHFQVQPVRGSSSRRGPQALLELTGWAEKGYDLAITPDGPRGPRYVVQEGVVALAQLTGFPILPISLNLTRKVGVNSWDRFQMPLPWAHCEVKLGELVRVPRAVAEADRESIRRHLETAMRNVTRD
jgi:lysophospholipid acyltransferase (LPLAT)-like uncharacterized protein